MQSEFIIDLISESATLTGQSVVQRTFKCVEEGEVVSDRGSVEMVVRRYREELMRLYESSFSHISNIFLPDFEGFLECIVLADFCAFKPGDKMIWGASLPLKGLIAHLQTYVIGAVDPGWIDRAAASIGTCAEECRKRTSLVVR